jgi:PD-(D/E)XK nuclease superfamily
MGANGAAAVVAAAAPASVPARLPLRCDGTRLMVLSASSLRLFWRCPERWRRRYLERERQPQTGPMLVGSAVGAAATAHFAARMAGEPLSAGATDDILVAEFDERVERPRTSLGEHDPGELREWSREGAARLSHRSRFVRAPDRRRAPD